MNFTYNFTNSTLIEETGLIISSNILNISNISNISNIPDISDLSDNDNDEPVDLSLTYLMIFMPFYGLVLLIILTFYINCISDPLNKLCKRTKQKYYLYFQNKNSPIKNNKLNKTYINMLNKDNKNKDGMNDCNNICSICMEVITTKEYDSKKTIVPDCKHYFHTSCLNEWVKTKTSDGNKVDCPTCRGDIIRHKDVNKIKTTNIDYIVMNVNYDSDSSTFSFSEYD